MTPAAVDLLARIERAGLQGVELQPAELPASYELHRASKIEPVPGASSWRYRATTIRVKQVSRSTFELSQAMARASSPGRVTFERDKR